MAKLKCWVKRSNSRLLMLFFLSFVLSPYFSNLPFTRDDSSNSVYRDFITPVAALRSRSSFLPLSFFSGSDRLHLLFLHELLDYDVYECEYYHMFQLENESWSQPKKILDFGYYNDYAIIFSIVPNDKGFIVYLRNGNHIDMFNDGYEALSLRVESIQYNEALDSWEDPVEVFGDTQIRGFLSLPNQKLHTYLHSFYLDSDLSYYVVWSFKFADSELDTFSNYSQQFMLSIVDIDGSITSFSLNTPDGLYKRNQFFHIIPVNDSFFLYTARYTKRVILLPNRSLSSWVDTNFTGPYTKFFQHFYNELWRGSIYAHRFMTFYSDYRKPLVLVDLAKETLAPVNLVLPLIDIFTGHREIDLELNHSALSGNQLVTVLIQNNSMELWSVDWSSGNCTHVSTLNQTVFTRSPLREEVSMIELIEDGSNWRIFWDQQVKKTTGLDELFTVTYFSDSGEWSPVTQVTFTANITDDEFIYPKPSESFSLFFFVAVLLCFILFHRKVRGGRG